MSSALIAKLRKAREFSITAGGHQFTARRPTDAEAIDLREVTPLEIVRRFVVGWDLKELDVIPGGGPEATPFDAALWAEWIADQPQLWTDLAIPILDAFKRHVDQREVAEKN
jgi:hypothetical protein